MNKQIKVKPNVHRLIQFLSFIEDGEFKIPTFQRDFVWGNKEKLELFDSISKEYPIGSILLWKPKTSFENKSNIGPYEMVHNNDSNFFYILDGFQRLSTLFGCLTNPEKTKLEVDKPDFVKNFSIFYDLKEEEFKMRQSNSITDIPIYLLIDTFDFLDYVENLRTQIESTEEANLYIERAKNLSSTLIDYQIPSIEVYGGNIKDAVDIFSRVNSKGVEISSDWMLSALTSNEEDDFNLGSEFEKLLIELKEYNFGNIKREILVQCIQSSFGKIYFDQKIEDLPKNQNFRDLSLKTIKSIKKAIQFLFENLLVVNKKLLPYTNQLIFLTQFFNHVEVPSDIQREKLKKWFWITTYSNYFTIFSLSKIRLAFNQFKLFIANEIENPVYYEKKDQKFATADLPKSVTAGSVRSKALQLFLLNMAHNFKPVKVADIETFKLVPLFKKDRSHASIVPLLIYAKSSVLNIDFNYNKQNDLSYVLKGLVYTDIYDKYFMETTFIDLYSKGNADLILDKRLELIQQMENKFVSKHLKLEYTKIY